MKRFLKARKGDIYLFAFYKKHKDCKIHISIGDEVPFKGTISRTKQFHEVDFVFTERFSDFEYINKKKFHRFFIKINVERSKSFNISFRFELSEPRIVVRNRDLKIPIFAKRALNPNFHNDMLKSLQDLDIFGGLPRYKKDNSNIKSKKKKKISSHSSCSIVKFNKRAVSSYNLSRRIASAKHFRTTDKRIISAKKIRNFQKRNWRQKIINKIEFKGIKLNAFRLEKQVKKYLTFQKKWIQVLRIFAVIHAMLDKFACRVNEIDSFQLIAKNMKYEKEAFLYPQILYMYIYISNF